MPPGDHERGYIPTMYTQGGYTPTMVHPVVYTPWVYAPLTHPGVYAPLHTLGWWEEGIIPCNMALCHPRVILSRNIPPSLPGYTATRTVTTRRLHGGIGGCWEGILGSRMLIIMVNSCYFSLISRKCDVWYAF